MRSHPLLPTLSRWASLTLLLLLLMASAASCFADSYSDEGTVFINGTLTDIQNQETCDRYDCQIGSSWNLWMHFQAPDWNAPGSNYFISTVLLTCFGGPPCIDKYGAGSDFGWGPYGFDILSIEINDGKVVDARVGTNGYFIEWGESDIWQYVDAFSGSTIGYVAPGPEAPEPAAILSFASGIGLIGLSLKLRRLTL